MENFVQTDKMQQSKAGLIPEDWDEVKIKDIAEVNRKSLTGKTPKNYVFNYIDLSAVKKGIIDFSTDKIRFKDAPSRARTYLEQRRCHYGDSSTEFTGVCYCKL